MPPESPCGDFDYDDHGYEEFSELFGMLCPYNESDGDSQSSF